MQPRNSGKPGSYSNLVFQWIAGIALFLFGGIKLDAYLSLKTPIATWLLPLIFITGMMIKLIVETNKKK